MGAVGLSRLSQRHPGVGLSGVGLSGVGLSLVNVNLVTMNPDSDRQRFLNAKIGNVK
jgi:hypothetical protein